MSFFLEDWKETKVGLWGFRSSGTLRFFVQTFYILSNLKRLTYLRCSLCPHLHQTQRST